MSNIIEKILSYLVGGMVGAVIGFILVSFNMPTMLDPEMEAMVLVIIMAVVGILASVAFTEYQTTKEIKNNTLIRDETVALITHEMRTGLTSTGWAIDLVLKKYKDSLDQEDTILLQDVVSSIHTTVMHSVNLLDISLLDIKKLYISLTWTKLDRVEEMFKEVLEKYSLGAGQKGITLVTTLSLDHNQGAEVDMMRLRIILENLLENAVQYTLDDRKIITVSITNDAKNMHISVADTGIGIPASEQGKIFAEFYRASNARKQQNTGSGIGLYTCSQYVKAHRGTIRFESKEGEGTTFFISIPLKTVADVKGFAESI